MMNPQLGVQGRYRMVAFKIDGSERMVADWFENLILDNGLNNIQSSVGMLSSCFVGSGTTAPAAGQTQLANLVATNSTVGPNSGLTGNNLAGGFGWERRVYRFNQGVAAGNLSEVGVGFSSTNLFSRARILDGLGNPTTITVLADEFLDVTYELRVYWPTADVTGNVSINGVSTAFVMRTANAGSWGTNWLLGFFGSSNNLTAQCFSAGAPLGTIEGTTGGTFIGSNGSSSRVGSYVTGSFSRTFRLTFGLNDVTQSIGAMRITGQGSSTLSFQCSFNPAIPKTNQNTFNADFTLTWARRSI